MVVGICHVSRFARKGKFQGMRSVGCTAQSRLIFTGMDDECCREAVKNALGTHVLLAGRRFFCRTAVNMNCRHIGCYCGKGQGSADTHGCNQVVAAAMAQSRQGIVFG
jgi:hypothetical protein